MNDLAHQITQDDIDYRAGKKHCEQGLECPQSATQAFIAGYGEQYAIEAQLTHESVERENRYGTNSN